MAKVQDETAEKKTRRKRTTSTTKAATTEKSNTRTKQASDNGIKAVTIDALAYASALATMLPIDTQATKIPQSKVHILPTLGLVHTVKDQATYGLGSVKLPQKGGFYGIDITVYPNMYRVIAAIYKYVNEKETVIAYSLLDSNNVVKVVPLSNIGEYLDKIIGVQNETEKKLGVISDAVAISTKYPYNKIYTNFYDTVGLQDNNYHKPNDKIHILPPRLITQTYLQQLSDKDLTEIAQQLFKTYLYETNNTNVISTVTWNYADDCKSPQTVLTRELVGGATTVNSNLENYYITAEILLPRTQLLQYPQYFYPVLLHELIHTTGIIVHSNVFESKALACNRTAEIKYPLHIPVWDGRTDVGTAEFNKFMQSPLATFYFPESIIQRYKKNIIENNTQDDLMTKTNLKSQLLLTNYLKCKKCGRVYITGANGTVETYNKEAGYQVAIQCENCGTIL